MIYFTQASYFIKQYSVATHKSATPNSDTYANEWGQYINLFLRKHKYFLEQIIKYYEFSI